MDLINAFILLLHPVLATLLLVWIWWQYSWRRKSYELKGEQRNEARSRHETMGERLLYASFGVVAIAFMARATVAWRSGEPVISSLIPQSLHGFMGPVGLGLLYALARMGRKARDARATAVNDAGGPRFLYMFPPGQKWSPAPCSMAPLIASTRCAAIHLATACMSLAISVLRALKCDGSLSSRSAT